MTRVCIFGAGAIGGLVGAKLALKGECDVSLVARGPHLAAIQSNGLILKQAGETHTLRIAATARPADLGPQDFVILTLKAHAITGVVWGRAESIILDGELLKAGLTGKSGRVLLRLDEARNTAIVRINGRDTELAIPDSMRPMRERAPVPVVPPVTGGSAANHPR